MKSVDKYVYPDTNILINKFDCRDEDKLREIEALSTGGNLAYLQLHPIKGNFDFKHLKDIHHFIFQDIFDWAGQIRTIDIGKGNLFCRAQFIESYAESVFGDFFSSCFEARYDYKDRDILVTADARTILDMMSGKLDMVHAYLTHKISAEGDLGKVDILKKLIGSAKKAEKAAAKAEKKTAKTAKKTK